MTALRQRCFSGFGAVLLLCVLLESSEGAKVKAQDDDGDQTCALAANGQCLNTNSDSTPPLYPECGVYMAPSTLGNDTNLGIYTTRDLESGDIVNYSEIVIPFLWRYWGEHPPVGDGDGTLWDRYIWEGDVAGTETFKDTDRSAHKAVFVPGVGCTVNSILEMNNIDSTHGSTYDTAGIARGDPGSGAFSPYHNAETSASRFVPAGSELFASYGDDWIPTIEGAQITTNEVLDSAEEFMDDYWQWLEETSKKHTVTSQVKEALWEFTQAFPDLSRVFSVLPRADWVTVETALKSGTVAAATAENKLGKEKSVIRQFIRHSGTRPLEWFAKNGWCADHLKPGESTLPHAGRGAFASRNLPKGTIVGYSPLVHVGEKAMELWNISYDNSTSITGEAYSKTDLIINYSFGHKDSSLILTPYGAMVNFINHSKKQANVRVEWPTKESIAHKPEWLTKDVPFFRNTIDKIGLSFHYVALRDLKEGEEIFMDYGDEWQAAWDQHVKEWVAPKDASSYVHSTQFVQEYFRTVSEEPYPPNLHTMCFESYRKDADTGLYNFLPVEDDDQHVGRVYCKVLKRSEHGADSPPALYTYVVEMALDDGEIVTVHEMTKVGLFLYDKVYSGDWHLPNAFRHKMYIPDDVFPELWMNKK
jgi:hypothetical protein